MPRYLITGARGFIGKHLTDFIKNNEPASDVLPVGHEWDLTDPIACKKLLSQSGRLDYLFHLADVSGNVKWSASHSADQFFDNTKISLSILESMREVQPQARLVGFSSLWAYPEKITLAREDSYWDGPLYGPTRHYGMNKKLFGIGLLACKQQHQMRGTVLVLGSVYGPGDHTDHVIPSLINKMKCNPNMIEVWGDGSQTRDFIYVEDQVRAIFLHKDFDGDLLNISSGQSHSVREVVDTLARLLNYNGQIVYRPAEGAGVSERRVDITKASMESGWPVKFKLHSLEEGLLKTLMDA